ncbi:hypothetical protein IJI55_00945 [Candidatus Saccharibacteria bacterium]|nr:hypothetical protein [Candidatus Saccharibacteria bacterium]
MGIFKKHIPSTGDPVEARFIDTFNLVKDFERADFKRWHESTKEMYDAYQKAKKAQTIDEKEEADIKDAEKKLDFIEEEK